MDLLRNFWFVFSEWYNETCSSSYRFWYFNENETIKNETKEQKGGFLVVSLGTLGASLLRNLLTGKGILRAGTGTNKGKEIVRAGTRKQWGF